MSTRDELRVHAKFRATCDRCGAKSPRFATDYTTARWMAEHEDVHRQEYHQQGDSEADR